MSARLSNAAKCSFLSLRAWCCIVLHKMLKCQLVLAFYSSFYSSVCVCVSWGLYYSEWQVWPVKELTQLWYHPHPQPKLFIFEFKDWQNVLVRRIRCPSMAAHWFKWQTLKLEHFIYLIRTKSVPKPPQQLKWQFCTALILKMEQKMFRRDHSAHESVVRSSSTTFLAHLILDSVKEYL